MIVEYFGHDGSRALRWGAPGYTVLKGGVEFATVREHSANGGAPLRRLGDVSINVTRHLVTSSVSHIFLIKRLIPQLCLPPAATPERDVQRHVRSNGVGKRINFNVVPLMFIKFSRSFTFLRMAQLV
jgi:hypothetical protein